MPKETWNSQSLLPSSLQNYHYVIIMYHLYRLCLQWYDLVGNVKAKSNNKVALLHLHEIVGGVIFSLQFVCVCVRLCL